MKKILKIILITSFSLICVYVSLGCAYFLIANEYIEIENKLPITKDELIGKTKKEVLQIAFEKSPRVFNEESLRISTMTKFKQNSLYSHYYENIAQVLENKDIMDSDIWGICYKDLHIFIIIQVDYWVLKFENNKVISVKKERYSKI